VESPYLRSQGQRTTRTRPDPRRRLRVREPRDGESLVTINAGETVTFSYPEGASSHNVDFLTIAPTTWAQTAGAVAGAVPPLPAFPSPPGWAGVCRFDTRSR
jgi:hypothetical protein